jgi:hypothetical protein
MTSSTLKLDGQEEVIFALDLVFCNSPTLKEEVFRQAGSGELIAIQPLIEAVDQTLQLVPTWCAGMLEFETPGNEFSLRRWLMGSQASTPATRLFASTKLVHRTTYDFLNSSAGEQILSFSDKGTVADYHHEILDTLLATRLVACQLKEVSSRAPHRSGVLSIYVDAHVSQLSDQNGTHTLSDIRPTYLDHIEKACVLLGAKEGHSHM